MQNESPICSINPKLAAYIYQMALRDVAPEVALGAVDGPTSLRIAQEAVAREYPNAVCAFAYGSAVRGTAKAYSDIDVVVFEKSSDNWDHRCINLDGYLVEISKYSLDTIDDLFSLAAFSGLALCLNAVSEGVAILDTEDIASALKEKMTAAFEAGPPALMRRKAEQLRGRITAGLVDLCSQPSKEEAFAIAMGMYDSLMNLAQATDRLWLMIGKWTARNITLTRPALIPNLSEGMRQLLDGNATHWVATACEILQPSGGPLWAGLSISHSVPAERLGLSVNAAMRSMDN